MTVEEFKQNFFKTKNGRFENVSFEAKVKATNEKIRCATYNEYQVFVYRKGSRKYGHSVSIDSFLANATPIIKRKKDEGEEWHTRCKTCEARLVKSGLWPQYRELYHNLQKIPYADWEQMRRDLDWDADKEKLIYWIKKYPFISPDGVNLDYNYIGILAYAQLKTMYFGKYDNARIKSEIAQAIKEKRKYDVYKTVNYDVTFHYYPEDNRATYAEEYRNCGNGHYYLALDESAAVFYEDD